MREVPLARRNLFSNRRRLALSVLGVGFAVALIFLVEGFWGGLRTQVSAFEDNAGAQVYAGAAGTRNFLSGTSIIPTSALAAVRDTPGVRAADPINARFVVLTFHDRRQAVMLIGYNPGGQGGPWNMAEGRPVEGDDEVVLDRVLAEEHGIKLGDSFRVLGQEFRVVGLSAGTRAWMLGFVFVSFPASQALFRAPDSASFLLLATDGGMEIAPEIETRTGLVVLSARQLGDNDRRFFSGLLGAPFNLMVIIAFVVGTLIIAFSVYSMIVERLPEYGIIKAMGARRTRLFFLILRQTLALATAGAAIGYLLYLLASLAVGSLLPQFPVSLSLVTIGAVLLAGGLMGLLAAFLPARRVGRLDPAAVYRR